MGEYVRKYKLSNTGGYNERLIRILDSYHHSLSVLACFFRIMDGGRWNWKRLEGMTRQLISIGAGMEYDLLYGEFQNLLK
jgi:hypothetical protein